MPSCPICKTEAKRQVANTPYYICDNCDAWYQSPMPPKTYIAAFEGDPNVMSDADREVNRALADTLFDKIMGGKPGCTLDIGAKLPVMAARLVERGCDAMALDATAQIDDYESVEIFHVDFEEDVPPRPPEWVTERFSLITLIHTFEHLYRPVEALTKIRSQIDDDGHLFIRSPDHSVRGYERDLTPGHYEIHPFYHSLQSILQCLYESRDTFELVDSWAMDGYGQRDFVLRPISRAPVVALGMIVKNEERDLARCLDAARNAFDTATICDTGSTDDTHGVAQRHAALRTYFKYLGASSLEGDDWKLWNFGEARNQYLTLIEQANAFQWVLNLDADDVLTTPDAIRRASYWPQFDVFFMNIRDGGTTWSTHRMWKAHLGIRYEGRAHEYAKIGNFKQAECPGCLIVHHSDPSPTQENSNPRNLRILLREWEEEGPKPRTAFYLANTYKDAGDPHKAAVWYNKRIEMGEGFRDEFLFSYLYLVRALVASKDTRLAVEVVCKAIALEPAWMEFPLELARIHFAEKRYAEAIAVAQICLDKPILPTPLWRERSAYLDAPARLISWAYDKLGDVDRAYAWADVAREKIGAPDDPWDARVRSLRDRVIKGEPPAIISGKKPAIALHRPGAIGDILMIANLIPAFKRAHPEHQIHFFCHESLAKPDALGWLLHAAGCDLVMDCASMDAWRNQYERVIDLVGYPIAEGYPDKPMRRHLLEYFANEMSYDAEHVIGWPGRGVADWVTLPALELPRPQGFVGGDYATLQTKAGWSKYKEWGHWEAIERPLRDAGINLVPIRQENNWTLRQCIAAFANARMHIGIDSFCNHLTNYLWTYPGGGRRVRGVILWGSTQASAAGYPDNINISLGLSCQPCFWEDGKISRMPRGPCINPPRPTYEDDTPHACMEGITPESVTKAVLDMWGSLRG